MPVKKMSSDNKNKATVKLDSETVLQGEDYYQMVSEAAYYRAEKRNFTAGQEMEDWIAAENEIQSLHKEAIVS